MNSGQKGKLKESLLTVLCAVIVGTILSIFIDDIISAITAFIEAFK